MKPAHDTPAEPVVHIAAPLLCLPLRLRFARTHRRARSATSGAFCARATSLDQLLEVLELDRGAYRIIRSVTGDQPVRLEPFDAIQLELSALWAR